MHNVTELVQDTGIQAEECRIEDPRRKQNHQRKVIMYIYITHLLERMITSIYSLFPRTSQPSSPKETSVKDKQSQNIMPGPDS